jgi:hypothetical protein
MVYEKLDALQNGKPRTQRLSNGDISENKILIKNNKL